MRYSQVEPISKRHVTADFDCGSEAQTTWLRKYALQADRSDSTKVQVVTRAGEGRVVGHYALSAGSVETTNAPERVLKGLPRYPVPVIILTRLGVDQDEQGHGLGRALVKDALLRADQASQAIGARALLIHCENEIARDFYLRLIPDFEPSPTDPLHLYLPMSDLRKTVAALTEIDPTGPEQ